jgi:hypothetical protein
MLVAIYILYEANTQTSVWSFVIRTDLVQTKRAKCEVCRVGRCIPRLACWDCIPLILKTPGGWKTGAETCSSNTCHELYFIKCISWLMY